MTAPNGIRLLSTVDAAAFCDVDARVMRRWFAAGWAGAVKIGSHYFVAETRLREAIGDTSRPSVTERVTPRETEK